MKTILVVFTGGTIGSTVADGTINTSTNAKFQLLQLYRQQASAAHDVEFDSIEPLQILSENLAPPAWKTIIDAIEWIKPEQYDGVIVTHGTDTLAYTANALSFYFHRLTVPLLLVSSDYPLADPKANGLDNFSCAVEFIRQLGTAGVFVPYRNSGQTMCLHRGTHLTCSLQLTGDFYSVQNKPYLQFDGRHFQSCQSKRQNTPGVIGNLVLKPHFSDQILLVKPYPGLNYRHFDLNGVVAVLHDLYHSGTACATGQWGEQHALPHFMQRCRERCIPLYLAPAYRSENAYQSTRELIADGATILWNMTIEAALVKLMLAYGNFSDSGLIESFLQQTLAHEDIAGD
jgi:L-asparaginase/Glu-tRNA(Gln) amidotransferase subunit D